MRERKVATVAINIPGRLEDMGDLELGYQKCLSPGRWVCPCGTCMCPIRTEFQEDSLYLEIEGPCEWL